MLADRRRPPGPERPSPVPTARPCPVEPLLRAGRRDGRGPAVDAEDRRAIHGLPVLRQPADDPVADPTRRGGEPQTSAAVDADDGPGGDLSQASAERRRPGAQDLSLPAARRGDRATGPG